MRAVIGKQVHKTDMYFQIIFPCIFVYLLYKTKIFIYILSRPNKYNTIKAAENSRLFCFTLNY